MFLKFCFNWSCLSDVAFIALFFYMRHLFLLLVLRLISRLQDGWILFFCEAEIFWAQELCGESGFLGS